MKRIMVVYLMPNDELLTVNKALHFSMKCIKRIYLKWIVIMDVVAERLKCTNGMKNYICMNSYMNKEEV